MQLPLPRRSSRVLYYASHAFEPLASVLVRRLITNSASTIRKKIDVEISSTELHRVAGKLMIDAVTHIHTYTSLRASGCVAQIVVPVAVEAAAGL